VPSLDKQRIEISQSGESYALAGDVEGSHLRFVLRLGANTVGRGRTNDIVLEAPGVSDRHAVIEVSSDDVEIRDLASKNGTFYGGVKISSVCVEPGRDIQFGPVALQIEEVDPDDAWLSVKAREMDSTSDSGSRERLTSTIAWRARVTSKETRQWLELLDDITSELAAGSEATVGRALAILARRAGAQTAALMKLPREGSPIVLASYGHLTEAVPLEILHEARARALKKRRPQIRRAGEGDAPWAVVVGSEQDALSLMLAGGGSLGVGEQHLLRIMLRVFAQAMKERDDTTVLETPPASDLQFPDDYVAADSSAMKAIYRQIGSVAASDLPLLLVGETGVGKECLAQTVHMSSKRRAGPFLPINCAAIPTDLLEAELFGIAKGVATGVSGRPGRFTLAEGGTLFLDEIGDMSEALQAKLLRALEDDVVQPVGGAAEEVDVRLIAATNTDLGRMVESGEFRRDLYYRLAGLVVTIPPLRTRQEDLAALIEHFFHQAQQESQQMTPGLTYAAMRRLTSRRWPGNVRELRHAVRQLVFLCPRGRPIDSRMVRRVEEGALKSPEGHGAEPDYSAWESLDLQETSRGLIEEAMRRSGGNQTAAAVLLGLTRSALRRRLRKLSADTTD